MTISAQNGGEASQVASTTDHNVGAVLHLSDREVWWEVGAVLCISILPYLPGVIWTLAGFGFPDRAEDTDPYWITALDWSWQSGCLIFATVYLVHRSGEPWSTFGLVRPAPIDLAVAAGLLIASYSSWFVIEPWFPDDAIEREDRFAPLQGTLDYLLMIVMFTVNAFYEELLFRSYLVTRLERLLQSKVKAVLLSTLVFTLYHVDYGLTDALAHVFLGGLIFGAVFLWVRRIWPFAIGHALHNIILDVLQGTA